ncbi:MAG: 3'-5' exoribonuclease [Candidatus Omnitrophica bacterium]|nr:3'-5' exoribonuclease [Candidatus Omnitrophota bacterium]
MQEIYVSTDVESDGPIPGEYSMLSFGSAAFTLDKRIISTFSVNLETLPSAKEDHDTMQWWSTQAEAWQACRSNLQPPNKAMQNYSNWLTSLGATPVFVGYPASFDFSFISWYLIKFTGSNPFSYVALDIKSYAMAMMKKPFHQITKTTMPKEWFDKCKKSHVALEDAIEQGYLFCNMFSLNNKA